MANMSKFAAQQLTKKQMNDAKGGVRSSCMLIFEDGTFVDFDIINRPDFEAVQKELQAVYAGVGDVACDPWLL